MVTSMTATIATETAAPNGQLRDCRKRSTSALPMKNTFPPPSSAGMMNSPISRMKTSIEPVATPGSDIGSVTCRKLRQGLAPRSAEASSRR